MANTLQVASGTPFPVGPDPGYAKTLGTTFDRARREGRQGPQGARRATSAKFDDQAAAARDIQAAYAAAAKRLRNAEISPADAGDQRRARRSGSQTSSAAWKRAANAAADKNKAGFARSEAGIKKAQQDLAQTLAGLENVGYTIEQ